MQEVIGILAENRSTHKVYEKDKIREITQIADEVVAIICRSCCCY